MNIVTKIFIVLTLVCSILLSVMVVLTLGNVRPLRDALEASQTGLRVNSLALAVEQAKSADAANVADRRVETYSTQLTEVRKQLADLNTQYTTLSAANAKTNADLTIANNTLARNANTIGQMQTENTQLAAELKEARPKIADLAKQYSEATMANEQLTTKNEQAARAIDRLKEQLVDASKPAAGASSSEVGGVKTLSVGLGTTVPVNGKVVEVKTDNGTVYLALSLGERDNVQVGTRFMISRGDTYVGDAIVERVTPDQSVAIVRAGNPLPVKVNDLVSSGQ